MVFSLFGFVFDFGESHQKKKEKINNKKKPVKSVLNGCQHSTI